VVSHAAIDRLARSVKRGDSPAWVPRPPQVSMYQGFVTRVDTFNGIVDFQMNDPSGLVLPGVRYLQPYLPTRLPNIGDVVWAQHFGTDVIILGQHIVPNSIVTL
jgi:hypothetical protein